MASIRKPFEQYRALLDDGRSVVTVSAAAPRGRVDIYLVASSKAEALSRVRALGLDDPHASQGVRPSHARAELAGADPEGFVFCSGEYSVVRERKIFGSHELDAYLAEADVRYAH